MPINTGQQYGANAPDLIGRGAYGISPIPGSSNVWGTQIPMAGKFSGALSDYGSLITPEAFQKSFGEKPFEAVMSLGFLKQQQENTPAARAAERKQTLEDTLAFYKAQGDQQMKYNLVNQGLSGLREGLQRGFTNYTDPSSIAQLTAGIGDAYSKGAEATRGLTQLGAGLPTTRYYNI